MRTMTRLVASVVAALALLAGVALGAHGHGSPCAPLEQQAKSYWASHPHTIDTMITVEGFYKSWQAQGCK